MSESSTEEPSWLQEGKVPLATAGSLAAPSGQPGHLEQTASHRKESPPPSSLDFSVFTDGFSLPRGWVMRSRQDNLGSQKAWTSAGGQCWWDT